MDNLKKLMGSSYKDGITVEEINAFLGTGKFVNLNDGNYVDKDKYNKAVSEKDQLKTKYDELAEKTKDYDTVKAENDNYKGEKADAELKAKLISLGVDEKAFKYVKGDITDKTLTIGDDDKANKEAVTKYLQDNPQFAVKGTVQRRVVSTKVVNNGTQTEVDGHKTVNDNLRNALGIKTKVE